MIRIFSNKYHKDLDYSTFIHIFAAELIFRKNMIKKIVGITESQLKHLTSESIKEALPETTYPSSNELFDVNKIPMDILDKGWARYHPYLFTINHRNPLANRVIEESTDYKKQIILVKKAILNTFPISEEQFKIVEGAHGLFAAILMALTDDNVGVIEQLMENKGFFRSLPTNDQLLYDRKHRQWIDVRFEPKDPNDVTEEVHRKYSVLYHLTPTIFEKNILENGLKVSNNNPNYKDSESRAFLSEGDADINDIQQLVNTLYSQAQNKGVKDLTPNYTLFTFDLNKMGNNIRFFYDINEPKGLYTKVEIPPAYIIKNERITAQTNDRL